MTKQIITRLLGILCVFFFSSSAESVVYVDIDSLPVPGDGDSWATAYHTIQQGLNDADILNEEVWVADGTYYEPIFLQDGVAIYGGFTGYGELEETERDQRDLENNHTIIDGSDSGTVVFGADNAIINGFTIQNGNAVNGGGMSNISSSPTIANCTFKSNEADQGGGIYNDTSNPVIMGCVFEENCKSDIRGGGIYNHNSPSPVIIDCSFENNGSCGANRGNGVFNNNSSPYISGCNFEGNLTVHGDGGGGMYNLDSEPVIIDCTFIGNSAFNSDGGGILNNNSSPSIIDCTFAGNVAAFGSFGGGGILNSNSSPTITNCLFTNNKAQENVLGGGGIANQESSPLITNCIFMTNKAYLDSSGGGGIYNDASSPTIKNCIFLTNYSEGGGGIFNNNNASPSILNSVFFGNYVENYSENSYGGGIYNLSSLPTISNCVFSGNHAISSSGGVNSYGGGICNHSSSPVITDCTFSGNFVEDLIGNLGGGIYNLESSPPIINSILWGNTAPEGSQIYNDISIPTISYSDVEGCGGSGDNWDNTCGLDGDGNIDSDPLFEDPDGGDDILGTGDDNLHLKYWWSPCIDAGTDDGLSNLDIDNEERPVDVPSVDQNGMLPEYDMGADEYVDSDDDELPDYLDNCPLIDNPEQVDTDIDGIGNECDICLSIYNPLQEDQDEDGLGDICDNCPLISNIEQEDNEHDFVGDICDNCPDDYNPNQEDTDDDSRGDVCDPCPDDYYNDADLDSICGDIDNCPYHPNGPLLGTCTLGDIGQLCSINADCGGMGFCSMDQEDTNDDGIGNACDPDDDGLASDNDNCPYTPNQDQLDSYPPGGNDIGDVCECEGNFDCDDDCDGTDASLFKTDFGRSAFGNPCESGDPCNGNFDCDQDVDGTDAALFKQDFGRSQFGNPCPACVVGGWCGYE